MGLSGTETNWVRAPTSSPEYSMRYLCTILTIIKYSSSLANLCPIQALGERKLIIVRQADPYLAPWPNGILAKESLRATSDPSLRQKLFWVWETGRVIGACTATSYDCCSFGNWVSSDDNVRVGSSATSKSCRKHPLAFCLASLHVLHLSKSYLSHLSIWSNNIADLLIQ